MKRAIAVALVSAQFLLLLTLASLPHGSLWSANLSVVVATIVLAVAGKVFTALKVLGLEPALTASLIPREHAPLITTGVYGSYAAPSTPG